MAIRDNERWWDRPSRPIIRALVLHLRLMLDLGVNIYALPNLLFRDEPITTRLGIDEH